MLRIANIVKTSGNDHKSLIGFGNPSKQDNLAILGAGFKKLTVPALKLTARTCKVMVWKTIFLFEMPFFHVLVSVRVDFPKFSSQRFFLWGILPTSPFPFRLVNSSNNSSRSWQMPLTSAAKSGAFRTNKRKTQTFPRAGRTDGRCTPEDLTFFTQQNPDEKRTTGPPPKRVSKIFEHDVSF